MALETCPVVALGPVIILDRIPVPGMRADPQSLLGAVARLADIAVAVARLAGLQIAPSFDCMVARPFVRRKQSAGVARLALRWIENGVVRANIG
jgi:hypothetical protein